MLFTALFVVCAVLVTVHELGQDTEGSLASVIAIGRTLGPITIIVAAVTVMTVEWIMVFIEGFHKRRYKAGRDDERRAWEIWDQRRREAAEKEQDFNEPTPSEREAQAVAPQP